MTEIKSQKNYMDKPRRKSKLMNMPMGHTGFQSGGKLSKDGLIYKNNLLATDYTSQNMGTVRKTKSY
jgi:hypothetical protein